MQVSFVGRHVEVPDDLRAYAEEKVSKLPRYYNRVQAVEIVVDRESDLISVEMIVRAAGTAPFIAKEVGADVRACIDLLIDKMGRQLSKHKEKHRNRKHIARKADLPE